MFRKFERNKYIDLLCSLYLLLVVVLCISSCTSEYNIFDNNSKLLNFSVSVPSWKNNDSTPNSRTRATPISGTSLGTSSSFNIIADAYDGTKNYSTIIKDEAVSYTNNMWQTTSTHYWPGAANKTVSFYAYYPTSIYSSITHTAGSAPTLSYTVPNDAASQIDIITATGNNVSGNTNASTPLAFNHIFAAVKFAVGTNGLPSGIVKLITISGINNSGTYTFGSGWTLGSTTSSFTVSPSTVITGSAGANITSDAFTMMMIPQTFSNASVTLLYSNGTTFSTTISGTWNAGSFYTYHLSKTIIYNYDYTGASQTFKAPYTGTYKLEVWGAQGGCATNSPVSDSDIGKGGYSYGTIHLLENETLYICVGGTGNSATGGYNGGYRIFGYGGGGGGASHITKTNNRGTLSNYVNNQDEVLIVAGGAGGVDFYGYSGYGGGITGGSGYYNGITTTGGSQTSTGSGAYVGSFGTGGFGYTNSTPETSSDWGACGGGGWYGGAGTNIVSGGGGGGGSGHIGTGVTGTTVAGNQTFISPFGGTETGHSGNGYARITFVSAN
ncbi:fimbrillin family protein [Xylanibacter oryzae]|uniref:fimbrillin family protein n=1 Tax=Xylanibacter oryzae TaxID=185293 RepID=UPI0004B1A5C5|nr:fimbrillin family protein [Xylanibacter oryzae]